MSISHFCSPILPRFSTVLDSGCEPFYTYESLFILRFCRLIEDRFLLLKKGKIEKKKKITQSESFDKSNGVLYFRQFL